MVKDEIMEKMDEAADRAREELKALAVSNPEGVEAVAKWMLSNYLAAGWKRLGRMLADLGR